jgi:hypothetical protein
MTQPNPILEGGANQFQRIIADNFFLKSDINFIRQLFYQTILSNQQTSIWNLGSDAYFEYTSCYFRVVTLFIRNLFGVRLPYLLLIRNRWVCMRNLMRVSRWSEMVMESLMEGSDWVTGVILCLYVKKWILLLRYNVLDRVYAGKT